MDDKWYNVTKGGYIGADVTAMKWTTTPPTVEGWYWVIQDRVNPSPEIVKVSGAFAHGKLYAEMGNSEYSLELFTHWLGPLPVPEPPKD